MLWEKVHARVTVTLILYIALLMSGGVSQVVGAPSLWAPEFFELSKVEFGPRSTGELFELSKVEFAELVGPEMLEVTEPEFTETFIESDGLTRWGGKPVSVEFIMCGPVKGLRLPEKCLYKGR